MKITITFINGKKETANYPHITSTIELDRIGYGKLHLNGVQSVTMHYGSNQGCFTINN